jgi:hypothetical protein
MLLLTRADDTPDVRDAGDAGAATGRAAPHPGALAAAVTVTVAARAASASPERARAPVKVATRAAYPIAVAGVQIAP